MKVTLSEIKENLQGTNSGVDEAENQISDWEYKEEDGVALTFVRANSQAEMKEWKPLYSKCLQILVLLPPASSDKSLK